MKEYLTGHFVVASPHLPDPNFYRTVVLMLRHDEDGAFGVVLTRPLPNTVGEVWQSLGEHEVTSDDPLYLGGPVSGPLLAIHGEAELAEGEVLPGVHYCTQRDQLHRLVMENHQPLRIFSGYSGWAPGQLEQEFAEGSWLSTPATKEEIFGDPEQLWKAIAGRIGEAIILPGVKRPLVPPMPDMN